MASQTTSGYSTEGTQYAQNNSYYLLDTVPGSGSSIPGPVTVAGNLTVTGTTTSSGALAASSVNTNLITAGPASAVYAASGNLAISSATQASVTAPVVALTGSSSTSVTALAGTLLVSCAGAGSLTLNPAAGGSVNLNSVNALTLTTQGTGAQQFTSGGTYTVQATGAANINSATNVALNANAEARVAGVSQALMTCGTKAITLLPDFSNALNGFGARVSNTKLFLDTGLALGPTQGTFAIPAVAAQEAPPLPPFAAPYTFTMTTNKAVITTGAGALQLRVIFPVSTNNWIATVGQVGNTPTNVLGVEQNGSQILLVSNNPLGAVIQIYIYII